MKTEFQKLTATYAALMLLREMIINDPNQPIKNARHILKPLEDDEAEFYDNLNKDFKPPTEEELHRYYESFDEDNRPIK